MYTPGDVAAPRPRRAARRCRFPQQYDELTCSHVCTAIRFFHARGLSAQADIDQLRDHDQAAFDPPIAWSAEIGWQPCKAMTACVVRTPRNIVPAGRIGHTWKGPGRPSVGTGSTGLPQQAVAPQPARRRATSNASTRQPSRCRGLCARVRGLRPSPQPPRIG